MEDEKSTPSGDPSEDPSEDLDWQNRKLCSDPACIGVIGPDGCCKECGKPYGGEAAAAASPETDPAETEPPDEPWEAEPAGELFDEEAIEENDSVSDEEWRKRRLCSDPACIGVIGADGRCRECGKRAAEE